MADVQGQCDEGFEAVREVFAANLDNGLDVGASVAVTIEGQPVVDLWGGSADAEGTTPWERDTIINVWSTTKTMTALCALVLADRGEIDLHAPVATYWPEFKANGKEGVEVRHLLSHTAGLSGFDQTLTSEDFEDWEKCTSLLAEQAPWWEPGTASGYHAITQGYLVGEVVRRVTGMSLGTFFREELAEPLGADFHIGIAAEHDHRVARVIPPPPLQIDMAGLDPDSVALKTFSTAPLSAEASWTEGWRRAEIPAAGGTGNARSVARVQSVVSNLGEVDGRRYLSEAGCRVVFEEQSNGVDLVLGLPIRFGMGYGLPSADMPIGGESACFWGGWGGSLVVNDLDAHMTFAYVMNRMGEGTVGDERGGGLLLAAYAALAHR